MSTRNPPLADRDPSASLSSASPGCNGRGLSATKTTDPVLEALAARVRLAHEYLHNGEIQEAKGVLDRLRAILPEPDMKALACACVEHADKEKGRPGSDWSGPNTS